MGEGCVDVGHALLAGEPDGKHCHQRLGPGALARRMRTRDRAQRVEAHQPAEILAKKDVVRRVVGFAAEQQLDRAGDGAAGVAPRPDQEEAPMHAGKGGLFHRMSQHKTLLVPPSRAPQQPLACRRQLGDPGVIFLDFGLVSD